MRTCRKLSIIRRKDQNTVSCHSVSVSDKVEGYQRNINKKGRQVADNFFYPGLRSLLPLTKYTVKSDANRRKDEAEEIKVHKVLPWWNRERRKAISSALRLR